MLTLTSRKLFELRHLPDLLFRLHGWPTTQLLIGDLIVIIDCYTAIDWINDIIIFINILTFLFGYAYSAAVDGQLRHHHRLASATTHVVFAFMAGLLCL
uniref:Uncharacterized protein n=1 Tax=Oryza sativa subsp. japonica TaxID=39947 RepID=Q6Z9K6_ORYSJ|nr:hypothetical protein [Oryza sativa Japonica Group]